MHRRPIQGQNRDLAAHLRRWLDVEGLEGPSALETTCPSCEGCPLMEQMADSF